MQLSRGELPGRGHSRFPDPRHVPQTKSSPAGWSIGIEGRQVEGEQVVNEKVVMDIEWGAWQLVSSPGSRVSTVLWKKPECGLSGKGL